VKKDELMDAMGKIDAELIEELDALRQKKKSSKRIWVPIVAAAACVAVILGAVGLLSKPSFPSDEEKETVMQAENTPNEKTPAVPEEGTNSLPDLSLPTTFPSDVTGRLQLLNFSLADHTETVTPAVPAYEVANDLSNVINLDQFYLSEEELALLEENMFVVSSSFTNEFFELYEYNRYDLIPNFITVDSMMHTYHLYFSLLLNRTEKDYLADQLQELSKAMLETSTTQAAHLAGTQWEEAAQRNVAFFAIATKLQNASISVPDDISDLVETELALIYEAGGITQSPIAQDFMDYSQFKPRGYYEGDEVLEAYFRAMMWYGQVNYAQDNDTLNRSALLLTLAMAQTDITVWEEIYTVTSFFAGVSDDLGYYEYAPVIEDAYGSFPDMEMLVANEAAYETYLNAIRQLPPPAINSVPVFQFEEGDLGEMNKGFRFMGQRFTIDAAIMQQLVYRAVEGSNDKGELRLLPDTLDFPAALGSDLAMELLEEQGETQYDGYSENMVEMKAVLSGATESSWNTSLYSSWLYTLTPLLEVKGEGYPSFMTSTEWSKKNLETFAGSFTELKHDTVLYAKQVIAEMGGGPPEVLDDRGYVEPEPEVFRRFMLLAQQTAEGLNGYGLLSAEDMENLSRLEELARRLMVIANKELQNELLTDEEYDLIREYGGTLEHFWIEATESRTDAEYLDPLEHPASLVTDIATDPNGQVLQVATGRPARILVVVPIDGTLRLASGVVYDFYQFTQPIDQRLTDTEWRQMIGEWMIETDGTWYREDNTPDKPWWTESYWSE